MPILKMLTGLSGSEFTLSPGDEREFDEREAASLIRAGFAVATDGFVPEGEPEGESDTPVIDEAAEAAAAEAAAAEAAAAEVAAAAKKPAKKA